MRVAAPSTYILTSRSETPPSGTPPLLPIPIPTSSPPLLLPSTNCRADVPEISLPPQKRLCNAPGPIFEVEECSSAPTARPTGGFKEYYGFVATLDAEIRHDLERDIGYGITDVWSMDASDTACSEVMALRTTLLAQQAEIGALRAATQVTALQSQQRPAKDPAHPDVPEEAGSSS
ncbi:hypothetical protein Tco_1001991 [Tanacetum coccineum]|uniref:LOB domain-containing protein n=1 Tax=Tanacetum coccineum TaxID=301880 RepID=A0ABQ5F6J1_9ASTR